MFLKNVVPYTAVASAGMANVALMRYGELQTGVGVYDLNGGQYLGMSQNAARLAVGQTAISRAVLPIPLLLAPLPFISLIHRIPFIFNSWYLKTLSEICCVSVGVWVGLPIAIAVFPQYAEMNREDMEPHIQAKMTSNKVTFNKGV
eukprot:GHVU01224666.1.p1 GENE.GHVU01224666.1~~GHVU01224666.1.p1  ORF type:complete len:146 (+),score=22.15 GHVU01224666.1:362-799(+)